LGTPNKEAAAQKEASATNGDPLLAHFWIDRVLLLGKGWHNKTDCKPCKS
jgi:hypothetical protein